MPLTQKKFLALAPAIKKLLGDGISDGDIRQAIQLIEHAYPEACLEPMRLENAADLMQLYVSLSPEMKAELLESARALSYRDHQQPGETMPADLD